MTHASHPLFEQYPLTSERAITTGTAPVPYHTYDGYGVLIGGSADLDAVAAALDGQRVHPIATDSGRALVGFWAVDFTNASLGPHHELQLSVLVSHAPRALVADHPLALLRALSADPAARMLCFGLWNNTPRVVAYNRELLGLPAALSTGGVVQGAARTTFRFTAADGRLLAAGDVRAPGRPDPRVGWSLLRLLGLRRTLAALRRPFLGAKVVNPIGDAFPTHLDAQSFVAADAPPVYFWDAAADRLDLPAAPFPVTPHFVEHFAPFRFVYLMPEDPQ